MTAIRNAERDGYDAVQLAFGEVKQGKLTKAELGHLKKAGAGRRCATWSSSATRTSAPRRPEDRRRGHRRRASRPARRSRSRDLDRQGLPGHDQAPQLQPRPVSHGSHNVRAPGSIGASAYPARVFKGMRMPGQMGNKRVTQRGLEIVRRRRRAQPAADQGLGPRREERDRGGADRWLAQGARARQDRPRPTCPKSVFAEPFHESLVHEAARADLDARRRGTASTLTRGEVADDRPPRPGARRAPAAPASARSASPPLRRRRRLRPEAAPLHGQGQPQSPPPGDALRALGPRRARHASPSSTPPPSTRPRPRTPPRRSPSGARRARSWSCSRAEETGAVKSFRNIPARHRRSRSTRPASPT